MVLDELDHVTLAAVDPQWTKVVLLLHLDGSTADSSLSAHTPNNTSLGASVSTAQKKFGTASMLVNGGQILVSDKLSNFQFGAGQFTVECWVYFTSAPTGGVYGAVTQFGGGADLGWFLGHVSGQAAFFYSTTGFDNPSIGVAWTPSLNTWYHLAADRDASNVMRVYVDGVIKASATVTASLWPSLQYVVIGNDNNASRALPGYVDEVRITKGLARYGGTFTPPSAAFPDVGPPAAPPAMIVWW